MDKSKKNLILILILAVIATLLIVPTSSTFGKYVLLYEKNVDVEVVGQPTYRNYVYVSGESEFNQTAITERNGLSPYTAFLDLQSAYEYLNEAKNASVSAAPDGTYYIVLSGNTSIDAVGSALSTPTVFNLEATITAYVDNASDFTQDSYISQNFNSSLTINGNICVYQKTVFKNLSLLAPSAIDFYANGYSVIFGSGVITNTANPLITLYGGQEVSAVSVTDLTVASGSYAAVYGGGKNSAGAVNGNVNLAISDADVAGNIFGGGNMSAVNGNIILSIQNTSAENIYGGANTSGAVTGTVDISISGSNISQNIYGGSNGSGDTGAVTLSVDNTTAYDIFGGGNALGKVQSAIINITAVSANYIVAGGYSPSGSKNDGVINADAYINFYGGTVNALYAGGIAPKKNSALVKGNAHIHIYAAGNLTTSKILVGNLTGTAYFQDNTSSISKPSSFVYCYD